MPEDLIIRDALPVDASTLATIHREARVAGMPWLPAIHSYKETVNWMSVEVIPQQRVRVAVFGDTRVGFAAFSGGWLEQLYVLPEFQNQKIGSLLFNDACTLMKGSFQFWVFQRNAAGRRFYERQGCRLLKLTDGKDNEEREPDALYEWAVSGA